MRVRLKSVGATMSQRVLIGLANRIGRGDPIGDLRFRGVIVGVLAFGHKR